MGQLNPDFEKRWVGNMLAEKNEVNLVIGCIIEQLMAGNCFSSRDELCEHIAKLSGIPKEKVKKILEGSEKVWSNKERRVFNL